MNSTPRWARLTAPGLGTPLPPPSPELRLANGRLAPWVFGLPVAELRAGYLWANDRPGWGVDIDEAKQIIADPDGAALVSVRTWREHIGAVSGYNYIGPAGRIKGDVWGNCGSDAYHMQHYRNVDNTMRAYPEITANWAEAGILPDKWVAFYCGTGWRASETWFYAYLQGWQRIAVYDGGWFEWSADPANPIETGLRPASPRIFTAALDKALLASVEEFARVAMTWDKVARIGKLKPANG